MKYIFTLAVLLFTGNIFTLNAQYKVTKVYGRIKTANGNYLRPGAEVNTGDVLIYSSRKDKLWVIVQGKGEKIITPSTQAQAVPDGISQALSDASFADVNAVTFRAAVTIIENIPEAIKAEDEKNGKIIIEQENKFLFDANQYPTTGKSTFFLQIDALSQKSIIRPLRTIGDTLVIYYNDFLTEVNDPTNRYVLGFYDASRQVSSPVAAINPYFDRTNEMEDIIANTINAYKSQNMQEDSLRIKAYNNVYSFSGKPNGILFYMIFEKYWLGNVNDTSNNFKHGRGNNFEETDFLSVPVLSNSAAVSRDALPDNCSLRQYAPPVGNQQTYSTCAAWATAYATRTIAFAVSHNFTVNNSYDKITSNTFSPDFVYNNVQPSGDCNQTSSIKRSLAFLADKGALIKKSNNFVCGGVYATPDFDIAKNYKIKDFQRINDPTTETEDGLTLKMKMLLVNKNAIAFGMVTPDSFDNTTKSGIWQPTKEDYTNIDSVRHKLLPKHDGHAMCVIGYDDNINGGSYEIMNSWGPLNGNNGFFWVNYHDFFLFAYEMYTVSDFGAAKADSTVSANTKTDSSAKAAPLNLGEVVSNLPAPKTLVVADTKPKLKGEMELMLFNADKTYETILVNKTAIDINGDDIDSANASKSYGYTSFNLLKPLYSGNRYKIKFTLTQPSYVYVLSKDGNNNYSRLFPQKLKNESPLISFTNTSIFLPNEKQNFLLDDIPGQEKLCVLLSKSPIDINTLDEQCMAANNNIYQTLRKTLSNRLIDLAPFKYTGNNKIVFDTEVSDDKILAFFIQLNHLRN